MGYNPTVEYAVGASVAHKINEPALDIGVNQLDVDVDAQACLQDLLTRLPSMTNHQVKDLTPKAWAQQQRENQAPAQSLAQSTKPAAVQ